MTSGDYLASWAGVALSLAFNYVPGLAPAYDALPAGRKRLFMAGMLLLVAAASALWACSAPEVHGVGACLGGTWRTYASALVSALVANQATHRISNPDHAGDGDRR